MKLLNFSLYKEVRRLYQPKRRDFLSWISKSLLKDYQQINIEIIIVSEQRSAQLNNEYRHKKTSTNVISLEYAQSREEFNMLCGELILCDEVIVQEAVDQNKDILAHYAHMVIHGILHLQGLDHQNDAEAQHMEELELAIMQRIFGAKSEKRNFFRNF